MREARRVVRPGGLVIAKALSRFYPIFESLARGQAPNPDEIKDTTQFLADGQYRNSSGDPAGFTTSYFHLPEELAGEIREAGLDLRVLISASGDVKLLLPDLAQRLEDAVQRDHLLSVLRLIETEPSIIGMSQNFVAIAQAPAED
ncbi:hypothetical protein [Streptosporangium sp. NPDC052375]|uniref:hypothetical protein n=1 Tax=Streptosporangium sp. NPDC052375 TaxID=3366195 RepID=UPI0037D27BF3